MTSLILLIFLVISLAFLSSLMEAVILSVTSSFVAVAVENKKPYGLLLERHLEKIDRPLSAVLTFNTITNVVGSSLIAYQVQELYGETVLTLFSGLLGFCILIFCEVIPKSLGSTHWKRLASVSAYTIQAMIFTVYPAVWLIENLTKKLSKESETPEMTRDELIMTARIGAEEGILKTKESNIIKNLLMLDKIYVSDVMTPRTVLFAIEDIETVDDVVEKYKPIRFSRIPVYRESLDNIIGMTSRYRILEALSHDQHDKKIGDLLSPIATVSERMHVSQLLDYFIKEKEHLALALDEYGVVTGLVTLEDAIETLLGVEIVDEYDNVEDMRKYALEQWQIRKQKLRRS
ncbi:MAG: CNNM domain-containing protein [Bdellovibrionales bacterium]